MFRSEKEFIDIVALRKDIHDANQPLLTGAFFQVFINIKVLSIRKQFIILYFQFLAETATTKRRFHLLLLSVKMSDLKTRQCKCLIHKK